MTLEANSHVLPCPKCGEALPSGHFNDPRWTSCSDCGAALRVAVFPALARPPEQGSAAESVMLDDEASCFYHDDKKAVKACDDCGRFLCSLCSIELSGRTLCAGCIQSGKKKGRLQDLTRHRVLNDDVALALALLPLLAWPFTLLTAPAAIFWSVRYWNKPGSLLPRSKIRYVLAILFGSLQIAGWTTLFVALAIG